MGGGSEVPGGSHVYLCTKLTHNSPVTAATMRMQKVSRNRPSGGSGTAERAVGLQDGALISPEKPWVCSQELQGMQRGCRTPGMVQRV